MNRFKEEIMSNFYYYYYYYTTYSGPTQLTCKEGTCNNFALTSSGCGLVTSGNQTLDGRHFISNLEGDYLVLQGCLASCEGCSPTKGSGDLPNGIVLAPGPVIFPLPNGGSTPSTSRRA